MAHIDFRDIFRLDKICIVLQQLSAINVPEGSMENLLDVPITSEMLLQQNMISLSNALKRRPDDWRQDDKRIIEKEGLLDLVIAEYTKLEEAIKNSGKLEQLQERIDGLDGVKIDVSQESVERWKTSLGKIKTYIQEINQQQEAGASQRL